VLAEKPGDQRVPDKKEPADQPAKEKKELAVQAVKEKKPDDARPQVVSGLVKAVDAEKNTLTVTDKTEEVTLSVAKDASIHIDGKPGSLAGVPKGACVTLREFVGPVTARNIQAEGRWFSGVLKAVDVTNNTVTFGDKAPADAAGKTFTVVKDTFISIDGKPAKLAGIPTGANVNVNLYVDQQTVHGLSAEGGQVTGLVKAVDAEKNTITINDTTYPVAPDAHIGIDLKPGKLAGVPVGANVTLNLQVDQQTVLRICAEGSSVFGTVKAVDAQKNTITVTGHPDDRTFPVPADAVIVIDGKPGKLSDIPPGAGLHALNLCVDQQTVHSINVVGPGYHHVPVKTVDFGKNTLTIDDKAPTQVAGKTLLVAANANIEIDGKPGKLANVPPGCFVNLGLTVDGLSVLNLQAEGPNLGDCGGSMVKAVDADQNTITFDDKAPANLAWIAHRVCRPFRAVAFRSQPGGDSIV